MFFSLLFHYLCFLGMVYSYKSLTEYQIILIGKIFSNVYCFDYDYSLYNCLVKELHIISMQLIYIGLFQDCVLVAQNTDKMYYQQGRGKMHAA